MDVITVLISVGAFGIALVSLGISLRADRREDRRASEARQANPIVVPTGKVEGGPTANPVRHEILASNGGQSSITGLWIWMVDEHGNVVAGETGGPMVIAPGASPVFMGLEVGQPLPKEQTLWVRWQDTEGTSERSTGIHPKLHA